MAKLDLVPLEKASEVAMATSAWTPRGDLGVVGQF